MTKGHNKAEHKEAELKEKTKGQHEHLKKGTRKEVPGTGRRPEGNQSGGTKGKNSI